MIPSENNSNGLNEDEEIKSDSQEPEEPSVSGEQDNTDSENTQENSETESEVKNLLNGTEENEKNEADGEDGEAKNLSESSESAKSEADEFLSENSSSENSSDSSQTEQSEASIVEEMRNSVSFKEKIDKTSRENSKKSEKKNKKKFQKEKQKADIESLSQNKKVKLVAVIFAVVAGIFALSVALQYIATSIVVPSVFSQTEITDMQFVWAKDEKAISDDITVWKQANKSKKISKLSQSLDFVRIRITVPASNSVQYYRYYTAHMPSKATLDGKEIYNNKFGEARTVGNNYNPLTIPASGGEQTLEIYAYSSIGFHFQLIKAEQGDSRFVSADGLGVAFAFAMLIISVVFVVMAVTISLKNKNIMKMSLLSVVMLIGSVFLLFYELSMSSTLFSDSVFFSLLIVLEIYFSVTVLLSGLVCVGYKLKLWQTLVVIGTYVISLGLLLIESSVILLIVGIVFALLICGMLGVYLLNVTKLIIDKTPHMKISAILFSYISLVNAYNIVTLVSGIQGFSRFIPAFAAVVYVIAMYVIYFKQSINEAIVLSERSSQVSENSYWFNKIANMLSDIIGTSSDKDFAERSAKILEDIVRRNEIISLGIIEDEEAESKVAIATSAAVKVENGEYKEVYNNGSIEDCDYKSISEIYDGTEKSEIRFAKTYIDVILVKDKEVEVIFHVENISDGLSELFQNIISTAHANMSTVFSNYNLKNELGIIQEDSIIALAEMVEYKGNENKVHLYAVSEISEVICKSMGFGKKETRLVSQAAIVHDIGKIAIAKDILNKTDKLTDEEIQLVRRHTEYGYNILSKSSGEFMEAAAVIAYEHHERYNGTGYLGMVGEEIHIYARIVAVADVFDALYSKRAYKDAWTKEEVKSYIDERSGTDFDPVVVEALDNSFDEAAQASDHAKSVYGH